LIYAEKINPLWTMERELRKLIPKHGVSRPGAKYLYEAAFLAGKGVFESISPRGGSAKPRLWPGISTSALIALPSPAYAFLTRDSEAVSAYFQTVDLICA